MTIRIEITGPRASGKTLILREIVKLLTPLVAKVESQSGKFDGFADLDVALVETDEASIKKLIEPPFDPKGPFAAGAWAAVKWVEERRDSYLEDHGNYDPETGQTEFPDDGEYVGELDEIIEGLQKIAQTGAA